MRTPFDAILDNVDYEPVEPPAEIVEGMPYATHKGVLVLGGVSLNVFVLNTGQRLITEESLIRFFGGER